MLIRPDEVFLLARPYYAGVEARRLLVPGRSTLPSARRWVGTGQITRSSS